MNECDTRNGGCDQICVNKMGSHQCACMAGFEIQDDKRTCQGENLLASFNNFGRVREKMK